MQSRTNEAIKVFGSDDDTHPGVKYLFSTSKPFYVGGKLEAIQRLEHYDFLDLRCKHGLLAQSDGTE
jgi:sulfate adenylyltransferase